MDCSRTFHQKTRKVIKAKLVLLTSFYDKNSLQRKERRYFGEYECECGRHWMSAYSWEDTPQECQDCHTDVLPHTLNALNKPEGEDVVDNEIPHPRHLCGKCKQMGPGRFCNER